MSRRPREVIVGLDVGTTGVKAVAFGVDAAWRYVALREYPLLQPAPDQEVQDPGALLEQVAGALGECAAAAGGSEVLAISVSAGMHALMALDSAMQPLTPLVTWADARARDEARSLRMSGQAAELHRMTGAPVHPMTPLTKLLWFGRHEPELLAGARWWVGLKDYVLRWLTGRVVTELSSASGTGMLDMTTRTWSPVALGVCGVAREQLPDILPTTSVLQLDRAAAERIGMAAGTPVVAGAGDGPLGNLGTGAMAPGVAGLSLGTSGAVRMVVNEPHVDAARTLFCYALTDTIWVVGGAISNGGGVARWARRSLVANLDAEAGGDAEPGSDEATMNLAATIPAGSDGLVMLPYLIAERSPLWDPDLTGAFLGLRREHTRGHMVRAALEGVGIQLRLVTDQLDKVEPVTSVRATGGAFRSVLWQEIVANMLDRPLSVVSDAAGTALGAAALGLFALGRAPTLDSAVALLTGVETPTPPAVPVDAATVQVYDRLRSSIPHMIGGLGDVARLFDGAAANPPLRP
jgi:gluconokinase